MSWLVSHPHEVRACVWERSLDDSGFKRIYAWLGEHVAEDEYVVASSSVSVFFECSVRFTKVEDAIKFRFEFPHQRREDLR